MNRQIKFRAWDKTYSLMNYKVQVGNTDYADQNYTCNSIWVDYGDNKSIGWMNADDKCIDLMQFTGIRDMVGKEVYESDKVVYTLNHDSSQKEIEAVVEWHNHAWRLNRIWLLTEIRNIKVVGNVYEAVS
jgi:uncharacterized phage protein (TIGR01671 family)